MKHTYSTLLMASSLLLAGSAMAQASKAGHSGFRTIHPVHATDAQRGGGVPPNDDCSGAVNQNLAIGSSVTFTGDNTGATVNTGFNDPTVWESFTTTECADIVLDYCGTTPAFGNALLSLFTGCPDTSGVGTQEFDQTTCTDGNVTISFSEVPAGTWYYAVLLDPDNNAQGPYTINVAASSCPQPPGNDDCANAMSLTSTADCSPVGFTTNGATQSMDPIECNGFTSPNAKDVWFSFVCTNADQTIGVAGYNAADAVIELFSGSCPDLTSMQCEDSTFPSTADETSVEQMNATGLTVGATYYVRVYDYGHSSADHNFDICVTEGTGSNVGIAEVEAADALSVYPNPNNGQFSIRYAGEAGLGTIEVFDLTGRSVHAEQAQLTSGTVRNLDLGNLAPGQYSVRLTVNGVRSVESLMVK